jgi:hypothetical protein
MLWERFAPLQYLYLPWQSRSAVPLRTSFGAPYKQLIADLRRTPWQVLGKKGKLFLPLLYRFRKNGIPVRPTSGVQINILRFQHIFGVNYMTQRNVLPCHIADACDRLVIINGE